jgi:lipid II:glycine glycyltransferase (peptidoglycan interpeptide bridge formation enzyme)
MQVIRNAILELVKSEKLEIDNFINAHDGLIFHETKFNEIASEIFKTDLYFFLAYINGRLVGICPVHTIKKGILRSSDSNNGSFEIPYGGWVYDDKFTKIVSLWNNLPIRVNESITYWSSFMRDIPDKLKKEGKKFQTGRINLNNSEKELFDNMIYSKRRNMIRKAEKSGITITKYGAEGLPIYFDLMQDMHKKAGLGKPPSNYYGKILDVYYATGNALLMIASHEEKPLAGVIIVGNKNVMHYWQGISISEVPNFGQGELLQWEAIKWSKRQNVQYYDLCVIEPERLPHIAQFKMGFTRELLPFYCISKKTFFFKVLNKIQNAFTN